MNDISAKATVEYRGPSGIVYTIASQLTVRERAAAQSELVRLAGAHPPVRERTIRARRAAVQRLAPENLDQILGVLDVVDNMAPAERADDAVAEQMYVIEAVAMLDPAYSVLQAASYRHAYMTPIVAMMYGVRGWASPEGGPVLPPFRASGGAVPETLLDCLPPDDVGDVGWKIWNSSTLRDTDLKN